MKNSSLVKQVFAMVFCLVVTGCQKNYTNFYNDQQDKGLTIFSNHGNNILTCYIDGRPWRTVSRTASLFYSPYLYNEVYMERQSGNGSPDTLLITWSGYYEEKQLNKDYLTLHLAMPSSFTYHSLSALQGQRINLGSSNGFFTTTINGLDSNGIKGSGTVYFQKMRLDSIAPGSYSGILSGIFEADFNSVKFTRGRFDHLINPDQVRF